MHIRMNVGVARNIVLQLLIDAITHGSYSQHRRMAARNIFLLMSAGQGMSMTKSSWDGIRCAKSNGRNTVDVTTVALRFEVTAWRHLCFRLMITR